MGRRSRFHYYIVEAEKHRKANIRKGIDPSGYSIYYLRKSNKLKRQNFSGLHRTGMGDWECTLRGFLVAVIDKTLFGYQVTQFQGRSPQTRIYSSFDTLAEARHFLRQVIN